MIFLAKIRPALIATIGLAVFNLQAIYLQAAMAQDIDYPQTRNFIEPSQSHPITDERRARAAAYVKTLRKTAKKGADQKFKLWDDRFCAAEQSSALQFGELTYGMTPNEIKNYLGAPDLEAPADWLSSEPNSKSWLYILGRTPVLLRFVLNKDKCVQLNVQPYDLDGPYCRWRSRDLSKNSRGKTRRQILVEQGPPAEAYDLSMPPGLTADGRIDFWLNALKAESNWNYPCGDLRSVILFFNGDVCRGPLDLQPQTLGFTSNRTPNSSFKRPPH